MNDESTNRDSRWDSLNLACKLENLIFSSNKDNPNLIITPSEKGDIEESVGFGMKWDTIFHEQKRKSCQFMCTIRDGTTGEAVGFLAGRHRPMDDDGSRVSIDFLERSYESEKSKGYILVLGIQFVYVLAAAYGAEYVKINNPVKCLIKYYKNQMPNSRLEHRGNHCFIIASLAGSMIAEEVKRLHILSEKT